MKWVDRFWSLVAKADGQCWEWRGAKTNQGYGTFARTHGTRVAHRISWELTRGPIPDGLTIDHLCRNRGCVNPSHLEPVTNRENVLRGEGITAHLARTTACAKGHPKSENRRKGHPGCEVCKTEADLAWAKRRRDECRAKGVCIECFKRPSREGKATCGVCADRKARQFQATGKKARASRGCAA